MIANDLPLDIALEEFWLNCKFQHGELYGVMIYYSFLSELIRYQSILMDIFIDSILEAQKK